MKQITILFMILFTSFLFAQKVKIKNGVLFLDKKEVCKVDDIGKHSYRFSDLEGNEMFKVKLAIEPALTYEGKIDYRYLIFEKPDSSEPFWCPFDMEGLKFSLSTNKSVVRHLLQKNEFLTNEGFNQSKIDAFFREKKEILDDLKKEVADYQNAVDSYKPYYIDYKNRKLYLAEDESGEYMGSYKFSSRNIGGDQKVEVINFSGPSNGKLATYDSGKIRFNNGKTIDFSVGRASQEEKIRLIYERMLVATKDISAEIEKEEKEKEERIKEAIISSGNVYEEKGWAIDKKGEKIEGELTIIFQEIEEEKEQWGSIEDVSKTIGQKVLVKYTNDKGKTRYKDFMSKNQTRACLDNGMCYSGFSLKGSAAGVVGGGLSSLNFDTSYLYKEEDIRENVGLYSRKYGDDTSYIIKLNNEKKGIELAKSRLLNDSDTDAQKNKDQLISYLEECSLIKENIDSYNLLEKSSVIEILNDYESCKK